MNLDRIGIKSLPILFFLYGISMLVSMAGMEILSTAIALFVFLIAIEQTIRHQQSFQDILLFSDYVLSLLLIIVILGAFFTAPPPPTGQATIDVIGAARWIPLFFLIRLGLYWSFHENAQYALNTLLVMAGIVAAYAIIQHFTGVDLVRHTHQAVQEMGVRDNGTPIYRSAGFFSSPIRYGLSFGMILFFPLAGLLVKEHKSKLFTYLMCFSFVMVSISLVTTLTRGVWLACIAGLMAMGLLLGKRVALMITIGLSLLVGGVIQFVPAVQTRVLAMIQNFSMDDSRVQIWRANWLMFKEHPWLGVGLNQNEYIIEDYFQKLQIIDGQQGHAHNIYLQFLSGTGIFGFACYMLFVLYFFWISIYLWRNIPKQNEWDRVLVLASICAQVFMQVSGLTEPSFKHAEVKHLYLFILSVVSVLYLKYRNEKSLLIRRPSNEGPGYQGV